MTVIAIIAVLVVTVFMLLAETILETRLPWHGHKDLPVLGGWSEPQMNHDWHMRMNNSAAMGMALMRQSLWQSG